MGLGIAIAVGGTPDSELAGASSVEVHQQAGEPTTFTLRYDVDVIDEDLPLLADGRLDPGAELSVLVPVESEQFCLVQGLVHAQQIHLQDGGAGSWVEVRGSDSSLRMDRESKATVWSDVADSDVVTTIVGQYGFAPDVETTSGQHTEDRHTLVQRDTDLRFVRRLARRTGRLFWVTSDGLGTETAHFKRPPVDDATAATLAINQSPPAIATLDIQWDVEQPTAAQATQLDLRSESNLDGAVDRSPLTALGTDAFADIVDEARSTHLAVPADDSGEVSARAEGALIEAGWFLRATCQTSLEALGTVLRPTQVVEITGAGSRHSGKYFVESVRHVIDASSHRMELELVRNGWGT
jgi:phage protein D